VISRSDSSGYDAVVIGCGPGGSAVSTALALKGRRVVVLEKEKFPRYHIGESLIPFTYFALERIGMIEKLRASHFVNKYSVQFVNLAGKVSQPFYFTKHSDHPSSKTWQVLRSEFDQMLMENAREKGVAVHEQTAAKELIRENGRVVGVTATGPGGEALEFRAKIVIDASGRDVFTQSRHDWKMMDPTLKKIAVWSYWKGAKRDPGIDEGATTVAYVPHKGWFWYIPLPDDVISVGVVAERDYLYRGERDADAILLREVEGQPWVRDHVAPGTKIAPAKVTGDYSYRSRHCAADGVVLVGDAYAFLDPVFSSGVFFALTSGVLAADSVDAALTAGDVSAARFEPYGDHLRAGIESMRKLVYAFYDQNFNWGQLFRKHPHLVGDATDCLIGNVWKDFDELWAGVGEFAKLPPELSHGRAAVGVS
jgi:flavin-dependent dehydrogenase